MTFIEALAEYHKGRRIRRFTWKYDEVVWWSKDLMEIVFKDLPKGGYIAHWQDLLADDWIAEEK